MEWLHCNACGMTPGSKVIYKITSCLHVLCQNCQKKDPGKCPLCRNACQCVELNSNMPANIKELFMDPTLLARNIFNTVKATLEFQKFHQGHAKKMQEAKDKHMKQEQAHLKEVGKKLVTQNKKITKILHEMESTAKPLRDEIRQLKALIKKKEKSINTVISKHQQDKFVMEMSQGSSLLDGSDGFPISGTTGSSSAFNSDTSNTSESDLFFPSFNNQTPFWPTAKTDDFF